MLVSAVQQSDSVTHIRALFSVTVCLRILDVAPCVLREVPVVRAFYL